MFWLGVLVRVATITDGDDPTSCDNSRFGSPQQTDGEVSRSPSNAPVWQLCWLQERHHHLLHLMSSLVQMSTSDVFVVLQQR